MSSPGLSFVIPAYNEAGAIAHTVARVAAALKGTALEYEIIVVNDGSRDDTRAIAEAIEGIRVVSHPVNTGYGSAIKTGMMCARYDWIGIVDADGTYDIEMLASMIEKMDAGFDMVVAARKNVLQIDKITKKIARKSLIKFLNVIVHSRIEDPNSGFRIFKKDMAMTFIPFLCNTFSFTTSITIFALGEGYFVNYIPTTYSNRTGKSKVRHFRDSLRMIQLIMQGITFFNPVKFSLVLIFLLFIFGFLPSAALMYFGNAPLASIYLGFCCVAALVFALGIHGDIVRITSTGFANKRRAPIESAPRHQEAD